MFFKIDEHAIYKLVVKRDLSLAVIYPEGKDSGDLVELGSGYYWDLVQRIEKCGYVDACKVGLWYSKYKLVSTRRRKLNTEFNVVDNIINF